MFYGCPREKNKIAGARKSNDTLVSYRTFVPKVRVFQRESPRECATAPFPQPRPLAVGWPHPGTSTLARRLTAWGDLYSRGTGRLQAGIRKVDLGSIVHLKVHSVGLLSKRPVIRACGWKCSASTPHCSPADPSADSCPCNRPLPSPHHHLHPMRIINCHAVLRVAFRPSETR